MTHIHTSDPIQSAAAAAMQRAVDISRNEHDQAAYWQDVSQNKISHQMGAKRFGMSRSEADEQEQEAYR